MRPKHAAGLLDTSTLLLLDRIERSVLPDDILISTVTLAEVSAGPEAAAGREERARRQSELQQVEADFEALHFDAEAARAFGRVSASFRRAGRKTAARAFDGLIAAVAIANRLPLYTCNPEDFAGIDGLEVVAVPHPG